MASQPGWVLSDLFRLGCGRHPGLHPEQSFLLSFRHSAKVGASSSRCFPAGFGSGGWYRHSSLSPTGLVKPPPVLPGWTTAAARVTFILLGAESLFFQQDPQQDTVSLNHSGSQALVQLVWPCHGQVSTLAPQSRTWQLVLPRGAPLVLRQDGSTLQGAEQLFCWDALCAWVCMEALQVAAGEEGCSSCGIQSLSLVSSALRCVHVQPLHPSSPQHLHDLGTGEPGDLPAVTHLDHLSSHFIPGCPAVW